MSGLIDLFVPREKRFFEYLEKQIIIADECLLLVGKLVKKKSIKPQELGAILKKLQTRSEEGEKISQEIITSLHQTFITPIDRQELQLLTSGLSSVVDSIERIAFTFYYTRVTRIDSFVQKQYLLLERSMNQLVSLFKKPLKSKENNKAIQAIKDIEQEADELLGNALTSAFKSKNALEIVKNKELYTSFEEAIDDTWTIANTFEIILINHS